MPSRLTAGPATRAQCDQGGPLPATRTHTSSAAALPSSAAALPTATARRPQAEEQAVAAGLLPPDRRGVCHPLRAPGATVARAHSTS